MKTNKSLNELFHSASAEAEGGVPSQSNVEWLLRNSDLWSISATTQIGQRLYERLLSTPLRIGMTTMTTAAFIALGIIVSLTHSQSTTSKPPISSSASKLVEVTAPKRTQMQTTNGIGGVPESMRMRSFSGSKDSISSFLNADSSQTIALRPPPLSQFEAITPILQFEKVAPKSLDSAQEKRDPECKESWCPFRWYAGYLMVGANQITSPFTATLPSLNFVNGIRFGEHETLGLRIGFEFINPVIIPKYVHVNLGIDSHTFFGDGAIRPFIWGQASWSSVPFAGAGLGFGSFGLNLGAGPGIQFRTAPGFSLILDAGYQTTVGPYGAYSIHFGIGF